MEHWDPWLVENSSRCGRLRRLEEAKGRHTSFEKASQARQTLTPEEEQTLLDWCRQRAQESRPWSPQELRAHARAISGKEVGKKRNLKFECCHPELLTARPAKLDLKRAKKFNKVDFFDQYEGLHAEYDGMPPQHFWNEDEKGIQMGGGRKNSGKKYHYLKDQKNRYRLGSDNPVMECVSAAGDVMPPSFVLSDVLSQIFAMISRPKTLEASTPRRMDGLMITTVRCGLKRFLSHMRRHEWSTQRNPLFLSWMVTALKSSSYSKSFPTSSCATASLWSASSSF